MFSCRRVLDDSMALYDDWKKRDVEVVVEVAVYIYVLLAFVTAEFFMHVHCCCPLLNKERRSQCTSFQLLLGHTHLLHATAISSTATPAYYLVVVVVVSLAVWRRQISSLSSLSSWWHRRRRLSSTCLPFFVWVSFSFS